MHLNTQDMKELKALQDNTAEVLRRLDKFPLMQEFVFIGGSALALHFKHRLSEDLDFFTVNEFDKEKLLRDLQAEFENIKIIVNTKNQIDLILNEVKVTFCKQDNELLKKKTLLLDNIYIGDLDLIVSLKILTLFLRAKYRDYYDLYFFAKQYGTAALIELGEDNIPGFSQKLFENSLIYIDDIEDENINYLQPVENITITEIQQYFVRQLKK